MCGSKPNISVACEPPQGTMRVIESGGMNVELGSFHQEVDPNPLFKGLPDDRCQCPHWGYVLQGQLRFTFANHTETYNAGDVYYAAPGHTCSLSENTEYVEFSPTEPYYETTEAIMRNLAALQESV